MPAAKSDRKCHTQNEMCVLTWTRIETMTAVAGYVEQIHGRQKNCPARTSNKLFSEAPRTFPCGSILNQTQTPECAWTQTRNSGKGTTRTVSRSEKAFNCRNFPGITTFEMPPNFCGRHQTGKLRQRMEAFQGVPLSIENDRIETRHAKHHRI